MTPELANILHDAIENSAGHGTQATLDAITAALTEEQYVILKLRPVRDEATRAQLIAVRDELRAKLNDPNREYPPAGKRKRRRI